MGKTHGFWRGCKRLTHPFERVLQTAEQVMKYSAWLAWTAEWLTHPFEWVDINGWTDFWSIVNGSWRTMCHVIILKEWTLLIKCINKTRTQLNFDKQDFVVLLLKQNSNLKESCHLFILSVLCMTSAPLTGIIWSCTKTWQLWILPLGLFSFDSNFNAVRKIFRARFYF